MEFGTDCTVKHHGNSDTESADGHDWKSILPGQTVPMSVMLCGMFEPDYLWLSYPTARIAEAVSQVPKLIVSVDQ